MSARDAADVRLSPDDAVELIEILDLLRDWFDHDRSRLDTSVWRYTGGMTIGELRDDLSRMIDRLGGRPW